MRLAALLSTLVAGAGAFVVPAAPSLAASPRLCTRTPPVVATALSPLGMLLADAAVAADQVPEWVSNFETFRNENAFLLGIVAAIATRLIINEIRYRIEKPVMDKVGERVKDELTPDAERIQPSQWATLALCVLVDAAGDASELIPFLGEFTDVGFAPVEAGLIKVLFNSNALAAIGFAEEILPFTDIVPTMTISWALKNLWPTTPLAQKLLPAEPSK